MPLNVITGRSITITINSVAYSAQVKSASLIPSQTVDQFISLTDTAAKAQPVTWALNIKGWQDWTSGATPGFSRAMNTAAAAGTAVSFSLVVGAATYAGNIIPTYVTAGGDANAALENDVTFQVTGTPTLT